MIFDPLPNISIGRTGQKDRWKSPLSLEDLLQGFLTLRGAQPVVKFQDAAALVPLDGGRVSARGTSPAVMEWMPTAVMIRQWGLRGDRLILSAWER